MRCLIIEPECDGHYIVLYIKFIIRILSKKKNEIVILTSYQSKNHASLKIIKKENPKIKIEYFNYKKPKNYNTLNLVIHQIRLYFLIKKSFIRISKKYYFDRIFLNSIDHFDKALAIFGNPFNSTSFSGIFVNPKFHFKHSKLGEAGRFNLIAGYLFKKLLKIKNLKEILTNDPFFIEYIKEKNFSNHKKLIFLAEPREFKFNYKNKIAKKLLNLPTDSIATLVYGSLKLSKGISELLNVLLCDKISKKIIVILAGHQNSEIVKILKNPIYKELINKKKLFIHKDFQDDKCEALLFSAADIVWVGYQKNFPFLSGVLYQAAIKNIPIIASSHGIIGYMNKIYKLGCSVNIEHNESIIKAFNKLGDKVTYNKFIENSKLLAKKASPEFFMKQVIESLKL
jgi:hypothetical protein